MPVLQRKEQEQDEEERWNQHKFGLCPICKIGLDDKSEFTFNYTHNKENGTMMCWDCDKKECSSQQVCTNCFNPVNEGDVVIGSLHPISRQPVVTFCRNC